MAKESSDKPQDSVPDNPQTSKNESTSEGREATTDATVPGDIDALLAQAADSLTDLDNQVPNPSESSVDQSVPSDSRTVEKSSELQNTPPAQQPPIQQDKINQALNNLQEDMNSLNQQVGDSPQEQTSEQASTEQIDDSQTDAQDDDSVTEKPPAENIDDVLASLADEMQDVTQDESQAATDSAQPEDTDPSETAAEDKQVADDEINAIINQAQQDVQDSSTQNSDESHADQQPETQDSSTTTTTDQNETAAEQQENQSETTEEKIPAQEQQSTVDQHQEQESKPSSAPPAEIPVADEENPEKLADADGEPTQEKNEFNPEQIVRFPLPQRLVINTMVGFNKPFGFVPEKVKDILGIAALVTVLLSILTAALILFMLD